MQRKAKRGAIELAERGLRVVYATLWTSGPDATADALVRLAAQTCVGGEATGERFERSCDGFGGVPPEPALARRIQHDLGLDLSEVIGGLDPQSAWAELELATIGALVIVPVADEFEAWRAHALGAASGSRRVLGLNEIAALLLPGRLGSLRDGLAPALLAEAPRPTARALEPEQLKAALDELLRRVKERGQEFLALARNGYARAAELFGAPEPAAAAKLHALLELVEAMGDQHAVREIELEDLLEQAEPRAAVETERWSTLEPLPPERKGQLAFDASDMAVVERVFGEILPARFSAESAARELAADHATDAPPRSPRPRSHRPGQHGVAREVCKTIGQDELLLVHAPTGTGKTLAYLVPLLLWSRRHEVRTGVATYTRALQEQAFDREVPRALAALAEAGITGGMRISLLKGRENYLCWRALRLALPGESEEGAAWLAWTQLALFALSDLEGDLDRLPLNPPLPFSSTAELTRSSSEMRATVRARTGCCTHREDRSTCAAELARKRAERSHVVILNQALALARQEFFRHIVFDECEHLHDQAHSAWSRTLSFKSVRGTLSRLHHAGQGASRSALDRLRRMLVEHTPSIKAVERAQISTTRAASALALLERDAEAFLDWREDIARLRDGREEHSLLREFFDEDHESAMGLVQKRVDLQCRLAELESDLAEACERIDSMSLRGVSRLRRTLEVVRSDLVEDVEALDAWMPLDDGKPAFRPRTFYDVERDNRGELVLASRVLLPNEFLGRSYYPELHSAVFLSATTWLGESFDSALAYLGLGRAAKPAADEERPPRVVRTFRAPDPFDYGRVLVAVPRDAPSVRAESKLEFLDYVRRFIGFLGERTRGRMLVLFTNAADARKVGEELAGFFRARNIPLWFQNQEGTVKEELSDLFRRHVDSILLGVDTFWYGADFPGETLEYLVIVKLPYGVPDRYHHAQCAALGTSEQRRQIYQPRALAKFRQGFGRLMRRESDRGCVFVLDGRALEPKHREFLKELPLENPLASLRSSEHGLRRARLVRGDTDRCVREALVHMGLTDDVKQRGLGWSFTPETTAAASELTDSTDSADRAERTHASDKRDTPGTAEATESRSTIESTKPGPRATLAGFDDAPPDRRERLRAQRIEIDEGEIPF